ncbi:methyltransferase domain-containing protein [Roseomonas sp. OT10]|uniref:class I SAM-dependent methyltransferase n=1 Tax=Roseomonas cutis TaxID=2897332 RepID=UPI001E5C5A30|nr:class I SAM-dependent methyltransferase [Roseomonas sp. OT10]UFN51047.1 methyltransferase domain-containing protein [Roseomonas sp. OT10]
MTGWDSTQAEAFQGPDGLIDVRRLIAGTDGATHADRADRYYHAVRLSDPQFRKPFGDPAMARDMLRKLTLAMQLLDARPGQRVLDYGCGTGWLCRALAQQGLEVVGVDVSAAALEKSAAYTSLHAPHLAARIRLEPMDGTALPLEDASVQRILCYDVLHHLHDPGAALHEMARVLAPGGRAAFIEPGPRHSRAATSQAEMRAHGVIENDVDIAAVWTMAQAAGFSGCEVAVVPNMPVLLPVEAFCAEETRAARGAAPEAAMVQRVFERLDPWILNIRAFVLHRRPAGQAEDAPLPGAGEARLTGAIALHASGPAWLLRVTNPGPYRWPPAGSGTGSVNLGLMRRLADGTLERDFRRLRLAAREVRPGETVELPLELPRADPAVAGYILDLVAEGVAWFGLNIEVPREALPRG